MARSPHRTETPTKPVKAKKKTRVTASSELDLEIDPSRTLRHRLFVEYMRDPQESGIETVYARVLDDDGKPLFPKHFSVHAARKWCHEGGWPTEREKMFAELEIELMRSMKDTFLKHRIEELRDLWQLRADILPHLQAKRDKTGALIRYPIGHELEGLPQLHHEVKGGYTKLVEAFLKIDERMSDKRAETVNAMTGALADAGDTPEDPMVPTTAPTSPERSLMARMDITPEEMRRLAHTMLRESSTTSEDEEDEHEELGKPDDDEAI